MREAIIRKNLLLLGKISKGVGGGGVMSESQLFKELVVVVCDWIFFMQGGVSPKFKPFEKLFSLSFLEGGVTKF